MDSAKAYEYYKELSGKASDVARQLAFTGIALVWIFRENEKAVIDHGRLVIPRSLLLPTILLVAALASDLLQYAGGALLWGALRRLKERKHDKEYKAPRWINWPALVFFWSKILLVMAAYVKLFGFLLPLVT